MKRTSLQVRNLSLGEGRPKICIPIVGRTEAEIYDQTETLLCYPADLVEWRADWFEQLTKPGMLEQILKGLRERLQDIPLLFTIRTSLEGGKMDVTPEQYAALNLAAAKSGLADLVDVEVFGYPQPVALIKDLQEAGVKVIGSSHDFEKTPSVECMVERLQSMQELGVDICKLAVMPKSEADVIALLTATWQMKSQYADRPLITMSMGQLGLLSRLAGETYGSAVTFGAAGRPSAPGQIGADKLAEYLELLHGAEQVQKDSQGGHIFLIGFMGAGKSTVAAALKEQLGWAQLEMDEMIEQRAGQTISSMFEKYGETYFRDKETELLLLLEKEAPSIVSCGGGAVVREENCAFMKKHGRVVLLTATPETVLERVKSSQNRPILNGNMNVEYIRQLQEKRRALYESVADLTVATDGKDVETICREILEGLDLHS